MKTYIKFLITIYFKSFFFVCGIVFSLAFLINLLTEIEFFNNINVSIFFTIYLSLLNSPSMLFEIFPFIFLISTQLFFIKLFNNDEIQIFKYSGLKNSSILKILSTLSIITGIIVIVIFYNFSSNLKNFYLELKSSYATDGKYLAVITKNGLWIKDKINKNIIITNSSSIELNYLIDNFITEFDENFNVIRNIESDKIDISNSEWKIINPKIYEQNNYINLPEIKLQTNFNLDRVRTLYSNLSALNFFKLYELRENYKNLNYSITDVDLHLFKLISYPFYLLLIALFSSLIMLNIKKIKSSTFKVSIGLFFSVIIYYFNNFLHVLGSTEKISLILSISMPLIILSTINVAMLSGVNEK